MFDFAFLRACDCRSSLPQRPELQSLALSVAIDFLRTTHAQRFPAAGPGADVTQVPTVVERFSRRDQIELSRANALRSE